MSLFFSGCGPGFGQSPRKNAIADLPNSAEPFTDFCGGAFLRCLALSRASSKVFRHALPCAATHGDVVMLTLGGARQNRDPALTFLDASRRPRAILDDREPVVELTG